MEEVRSEQCARRGTLDVAGGIISFACAVHCLLLPILLPFAAAFLQNIWVEVGLFASAIVVGGSALRHGYRVHGFRLPAILFAVGMASILIGNWALTLGHPLSEGHVHSIAEMILVGIGGALIVSAHVANFILERSRHKREGGLKQGSLGFRKS